mgnify:CR=1 FL=1
MFGVVRTSYGGSRRVLSAVDASWQFRIIPRTGKCVITVSPTPHEATRSRARPESAQPVNSKSPKRCVSSFSGKEVPCRDGSSWWSNARDCYVSLADPQPAKSDPEWEGHKTGAIYECYSPGIVGTRMYTFWSATSPAGPAAPPDPRVLALRAVATMRLRAIGIGIVPEAQAGECRDRRVADVDVGRRSGPAHVGSDHSNGLIRRLQRHSDGEGSARGVGDGRRQHGYLH